MSASTRNIPLDNTPDRLILDDQTVYTFRGVKLDDSWHGPDGFVSVEDDPDNSSGGRYVIRANVQVDDDDPSGQGGQYHSELFFLGTEDDPKAEDPRTWRTRNAIALKKFLQAANVPLTGNLQDMARIFEGQTFLGLIVQSESKKNGETYANIKRVWKVGEASAGKATQAVKTGGLSPSINCPECSDSVPRQEFRAHVEGHTN